MDRDDMRNGNRNGGIAGATQALDLERILDRLKTRALGRTGQLQLVGQVDSTNTSLMEQARLGAVGPGAVLVAEEQTAGRGRGDHRWESPAGAGLYLSALLRPGLPGEQLGLLTLACGVAVCDVCTQVGLCATIRWPNDVLVGGRKLAGILCELLVPPGAGTGTEDSGLLVVAGIGLNVRLDPGMLPGPVQELATSLSWELGGRDARGEQREEHEALLDRSTLAAALLERLEERLSQCAATPRELLAAWQRRWADRGRFMRVVDGPQTGASGVAIGVDGQGALLLEASDRSSVAQVLSGTVRPVSAGTTDLPAAA